MARRATNIYISLCFAAILAAGCRDKMPENVIPPDKMEELLYDYHLAQSVASDINYAQKYKKEPYPVNKPTVVAEILKIGSFSIRCADRAAETRRSGNRDTYV